MALPKQIQKQIKLNEEISEGIRKELDEAGKTDTTQDEIDSLLKEVDPESGSEESGSNVTKLHPENDEGGDPASTQPDKPERTDWKQKYSVLKGKYDAEVPRLSQSLREANDRIASLEEKFTNIATPKEEPKEEPRVAFTQEEIDDYGADLLDVIGRKAQLVAEEKFMPLIKHLEGQVANLQSDLGATGKRVAQQEKNEVIAMLDRDIKDWREINKSDAFMAWLENEDPYVGVTRKDLLLNAFEAKDARRVKKFFEGFIATQENDTTSRSATGSLAGQAGTSPTLQLNDYVAPGTPRAGGQSDAPKNKRMWSQTDIRKFYADVQKGRYANRMQDKARIEADIVAASHEGRIQN